MDAKERWQALQAQIGRAHERVRAGDRGGALEAVDAALAIDPNFLAARALRERIVADAGLISTPAAAEATAVTQHVVAPDAVTPDPVRPLVNAEGYARFEQRSRRRRVDRRLDAAQSALAEGRRKDLAAAIVEIRELDPNLPELKDLMVAFNTLPAAKRRVHAGRWLAAAAVFGGIVLGASWLEESGAIGSRSIIAVAPLMAPPQPLAVTLSAAAADEAGGATAATGTAGDSTAYVSPPAPSRPVANLGTVTPASVTPLNVPLVSPAANMPPPSGSVAQPAAAAVLSSVTAPVPVANPPVAPALLSDAVSAPLPANAPAAAAAAVVKVDEEVLVRQTLQQYRSAYERLDAHSARAVWPAVNENALARAFDGLESQSITFESCNVNVRGEGAAAVCRGTTRYVPKIGSRDPRTEPRTWNFTLRKSTGGWTIESARAER